MAIVEAIDIPISIKGTEELKGASKAIEGLTKTTGEVKQGLESASKSMELTGKATGGLRSKLDGVSANFTKLKGDLSAIPGPVGAVVQGFTGLNTAFKAIIANPIGLLIAAIVLALTGLFKILTSTKEGSEQFKQVLDAVSAAIDVVRDRALQFGKGLKQLFTGDIREGLSSIKDSFSGIGAEIVNDATEAANLRKELQAIADDQRDLNVERAKQNTLVAESKLRINDENLSYGERLKALEDVRAAEVQLAKQEEELAKRRYDAIKAQNALSDSSEEALDAEAGAYIALQEAQRTSLRVQKELFDQERALRMRQAAEIKAQQAEQKAAAEKEFQEWLAIEVAKVNAEEANRKYLLDQEQKAIDDEEEMFKAWLEREIELSEMSAANAEFVAERKKKADEEEAKSKQAVADLEQQIFDQSQALANAIINIVGQQSKLGKGIALAQIAADTAKALSGALANSQSPTPDNVATGGLAGIAKYIGIATTILSNSKRAYDIIKAPAPTASLSGGGGGGGAAAAVPRFNAPTTRLPQTDEFTQVRRVYVTERDITNVQDKVRVTESLSQF
jgi:hypothetical protein